jgi:hypothetical protein
MAWIKITGITAERRTGKNGKPYDCTLITGMKSGFKGAPDEAWKKYLFPWSDQLWIDKFKAIGVGNTADVKSEKDGQFWKIVSVEPKGGGGGGGEPKDSPAPAPSPAPGESPAPGAPRVFHTELVAPSTDIVMMESLKMAKDMVIAMMENSQNFSGLLKKSSTVELLKEMVVEMGNYFYGIIKEGKQVPSIPQSDPSGVQTPPAEGAPGEGGEEVPEVPF